MKTPLSFLAVCAVLSGCAIAPDRGESWTDARLAEAPAGAPPAYVERAVLSPAERAALASRLDETIAAREQVRERALSFEPPTLDTAEFVVEARARALPPAND